ncbi:MAG: nucleoside kinase [Muribaculaceae bacterium]|nr:nucleoside kinase [Muribaculaceae bacterium]
MDTNDELKIYCKNTEEYIPIDGGDTLMSVYNTLKPRLQVEALCAMVNNKAEDLRYKVYGPKHVEFVGLNHSFGNRTYVRSLCMVLYKAIRDLYPGKRLRIEHSISGGYYCKLKHDEHLLTADTIAAIKARMAEIVEQDIPFQRRERLTTDVIEMFRQQGLDDKVRLLSTVPELYTVYYKLGDIIDSFYGPLVPRTGLLKVFDLQPYEEGMLLLPPDKNSPDKPCQFKPMPKMFKAFTDHIAFNDVIGIDDVGKLNKAVKSQKAALLINVAEALHNKMFDNIAREIAGRFHNGEARVVLIAGPSSSGKTTSSKRLAIQLATYYIRPKVVELDNYFVNREHTPRDEKGDYDYESLYALDLEQFNRDLTDLIAGREVNMPTYNFTTGQREYRGNTLQLAEDEILLIEGIHGLNPELTPQIPEKLKFRLYVSALTTLSIDDHNWVPTTDNRLLRRIIRDVKYRGSNAKDTIARWASVRRGEEKWIFPYQENADAMFNSSLIFELAVMRRTAEDVLRQVPSNVPEYAEANRLLKLLSYFEPLCDTVIPSISLLREFMGGSSFNY